MKTGTARGLSRTTRTSYRQSLSSLPFSIRYRYIEDRHVETLLAARHRFQAIEPSKDVLSVFSIGTCPQVRGQLQRLVRERLEDHVTASVVSTEMDWYRHIVEHRLVLCPRGNGLDTHRTWQTLYLGRIPVITRSAMDAVFEGLPVILLDDWKDMTLDTLEDAYKIVQEKIRVKQVDSRKLRLSYYRCKVYEAAGRYCHS